MSGDDVLDGNLRMLHDSTPSEAQGDVLVRGPSRDGILFDLHGHPRPCLRVVPLQLPRLPSQLRAGAPSRPPMQLDGLLLPGRLVIRLGHGPDPDIFLIGDAVIRGLQRGVLPDLLARDSPLAVRMKVPRLQELRLHLERGRIQALRGSPPVVEHGQAVRAFQAEQITQSACILALVLLH